jgi:hypothetical protein
MALEKIDKIKSVTAKLKPQVRVQEPNKDHFEALMQQSRTKTERTEVASTENAGKANATLFDEVKNLNQRPQYATRSSPNELAAQAEDVIAQIDILKNKLETPDLDIKSSVQTLLRTKLNHIDDSLKVALDKTGSEIAKPEKVSEGMSKPIDRFLGLLTHSQSQLETLASDVKAMAVENEMSPASMLLIQIKVARVQQEIELFTSMLNKALESTKTIMNVQV